ncbi:hypothetical protein GW17_00001046 [Ensete ventricosum]|uniref:Uncharacterized protein n=1 Tax=Ensete ventricosum TaxID=4639 RepID=A0A444GH58_ENSVE|nr:hypothetical protein B296_00048533 [Ensete ventricosum]RWW34200.1 hypothetical protein GW17_00001046 [Ensete ventricosum]
MENATLLRYYFGRPLALGHQLWLCSSEGCTKMASEVTDGGGSSYPSSNLPDMFSFKLEDKKGRMHRFHCETQSLTYLIASILQKVGDDVDGNHLPQILGLRLHLDYSGTGGGKKGGGGSRRMELLNMDAWAAAYNMVAAGAAVIAGLGMMAYLKRFGS